MFALFGDSERSEADTCRQRRLELELNTAGEQQQFDVVKVEFPPEQPEWSLSVKWEEAELPYIKEEQKEADIMAVTVKREEDEVHLSGFDRTLKVENVEENRPAEAARTSSPEGQLEADQQLQVKTPSWEEAETCDFEVKEEAHVVTVKSEENEDGVEFSQLHHSVTEDREDCGGPGLARNSGPDGHLGPGTEDETHSSGTEDSVDWMTPFESQFKTIRNQAVDSKVRGNPCDSGPEHCETHACKSSLLKQVSIEFGQKHFVCSECGKGFKLKSYLRQHEIIHTGEKPFSCSECGKSFNLKCNLRKHERIHTGEKRFSCSECGKKFEQKSHLRLHEIIHTGEKPFGCSQCGKNFKYIHHLRLHERIHTGEKPFSCSECDKKFKQKCHLRAHEIIHTGEKPFSCSECGKTFNRKGSLREHEIIHSGNKPFNCSECGKKFTRKHALRKHKILHKSETILSCSE